MRTTVRHTPPAKMQPCPPDNRSQDVRRQIADWRATGVTVHTQAAMEIAAWYHAPGNGYAPFASTGTITHGFTMEIRRDMEHGNLDVLADLPALLAYVSAVRPPVTVTIADISTGAAPCDGSTGQPECGNLAGFTVWTGEVAFSDSCDSCLGDAVAGALSDSHRRQSPPATV